MIELEKGVVKLADDLFFRKGGIYMLSLYCCDREFTELEEGRRKDFHDEILKDNLPVEKIAKYTSLSIEQIQGIGKQHTLI